MAENIIKTSDTNDLGTAIQKLIEDNIRRLNTSFLARVVEVSGNRVAVVDIVRDSERAQNPTINNVLVAQPSSKSNGLFFEVREGDIGLCFVAKKDISIFKQSGADCVKNTERQFDITDSIFLPVSLYNQSPFLSDTATALQKGDSGFFVSEAELLTIKNQQATLMQILEQLANILVALQTTPSVVGAPNTLSPITIGQLNQWAQGLKLLFKE